MESTDLQPSVLLVDDEESIRFTLSHYLTEAGYRVTSAVNMLAARDLIASDAFHVAVIDRMLPDGGDGISLVAALKAEQPMCQSLIISGFPSFESAAEAITYSPFAYLSKPVKKDQILGKVGDAWARYRELSANPSRKLETMGVLAGGMAHDFNNLLASILGYCELARMDLDTSPETVKNRLNRVEEAGLQARDLVRQVTALGRQSETARNTVSLAPLVRGSINLMAALIPENVSVCFRADKSLPNVCANASQIQQVVMNLLNNAVYAMRHHGGTLDIELAPCHGPRKAIDGQDIAVGGARLSVSDTGEGMPPDVVKRIFEPLFTTKPQGTGTGIGLTLVKRIVTEHGGSIDVDSAPECGTVFTVCLPAGSTSESEPTVNAASVRKRS